MIFSEVFLVAEEEAVAETVAAAAFAEAIFV